MSNCRSVIQTFCVGCLWTASFLVWPCLVFGAPSASPELHGVASHAPALLLTIQENKGTQISSLSVASHDCGIVSLLDPLLPGEYIEHVFVLQNPNKVPITVEELQRSDICIVSRIIGDSPKQFPLTLAPEAQVQILVGIDPSLTLPGVLRKSVKIMVKGEEAPAATLEMRGIVSSGISLSPSVLDFKNPLAGSGATALLTVSIDSRLPNFLPPGAMIELVSSNPDVQIVPVGNGRPTVSSSVVAIPLPDSEPSQASQQPSSPAIVSRTYKLVLSRAARLGMLTGKMLLRAPGYPSLVILHQSYVPFAGRVMGEISSSPQVVVFGTVTAGKTAVQPITLMGVSKIALTGLKISTANPALSAKLASSTPEDIQGSPSSSPDKVKVTLFVSLGSKAPQGILNSSVTVITASGQHLILPVFASVIPRQQK